MISIYRYLTCIQRFYFATALIGLLSSENDDLILARCKDARVHTGLHLFMRIVDYRPKFVFSLVIDPLYWFQIVFRTGISTENVETSFEAAARMHGSFSLHIWQFGPLVDQRVKYFSCFCHDHSWLVLNEKSGNTSTCEQRPTVGAKRMDLPRAQHGLHFRPSHNVVFVFIEP